MFNFLDESNEGKGKSKRIYLGNSDGNNLFISIYNLYLMLNLFVTLNRKSRGRLEYQI